MKHQLLIVDGYNMIGAWPELAKLKKQNELELARDTLLKQLSEYAAYLRIEVVVVFDAQFVPGITKSYQKYNLEVVFTGSDETADDYIETYAYQRLDYKTQVTVATSDLAEQWHIFSIGALRKPARELYQDLARNKKKIQRAVSNYRQTYQTKRLTWSDEQLDELQAILNKMQNLDENN